MKIARGIQKYAWEPFSPTPEHYSRICSINRKNTLGPIFASFSQNAGRCRETHLRDVFTSPRTWYTFSTFRAIFVQFGHLGVIWPVTDMYTIPFPCMINIPISGIIPCDAGLSSD